MKEIPHPSVRAGGLHGPGAHRSRPARSPKLPGGGYRQRFFDNHYAKQTEEAKLRGDAQKAEEDMQHLVKGRQ